MADQLEFCLPLGEAIAAATDEAWEFTVASPGTYKLIAARLTSTGAVTANDTNYVTYSLENATVEIATADTKVTAPTLGTIAAGDVDTIPITGTGVNLELAQGNRLTFKKTDSGSGQALGASSTLSLSLEKMRV